MTITEVAERMGAARLYCHALAASNTPTDPVERIKAETQYELATEAARRAELEFREAMAKLSTEELLEFMKPQSTGQN